MLLLDAVNLMNYESCRGVTLKMGLSKTEINLKRLLAAAPQQQNKAKLMHVRPFKHKCVVSCYSMTLAL